MYADEFEAVGLRVVALELKGAATAFAELKQCAASLMQQFGQPLFRFQQCSLDVSGITLTYEDEEVLPVYSP